MATTKSKSGSKPKKAASKKPVRKPAPKKAPAKLQKAPVKTKPTAVAPALSTTEARVNEFAQEVKQLGMQVKAGVTPKDKTKKLYRSGKDKIFGGVCGGLAEYLGVDATLIRVIWAATMFLWGIGAGVYLLAWILIPRNPEHEW